MSQRIELQVAPLNLRVCQGESAEASISLRNRGPTVDQFTIHIEGISPEWYSLPVSSVALFPNDQDKAKLIVNVPEDISPARERYPFKIKVSSGEDFADAATADLILEIAPNAGLSMSLSPASMAARRGDYQLSISNPRDKEARLQLKATDPKRRLRLDVQPATVTVPGQGVATATANVKLGWIALLLWEKTYDFQVSAEPAEGDRLSPVTESGRITSVPWYRVFGRIRLPWLSRPPVIDTFKVSSDDKREFCFKWAVRRAIAIQFDGADVEAQGETILKLTEPKRYTLTAKSKYGTVSKELEVSPLPLPKARTSENIKISLSATRLQAQAGLVPSVLMVQVQNMSDQVDKFIVEVEGLDESWYDRSASSIAALPKKMDQVQITFHPPKKKGVKSGIYPFAIRVHSQSTPQEYASVLGELEILPAVEYKVKVRPVRVTGMRKGIFTLNIANVSVSPASIALDASDLDDGCRFQIKEPQLTVGAWNTIDVPVVARPKRGSIIGENKRYDITMNANTENFPPQAIHGEFTHRPLMKSWKPIWRMVKLVIAVAVVVVAAYFVLRIGGGWSAFRASPANWLRDFVDAIQGWFNR